MSSEKRAVAPQVQKDVSVFADRKQTKVPAGPKRSNARRCFNEGESVYENELWSNWQTSDQSDNRTVSSGRRAEAPEEPSSNVLATVPSTDEHATELPVCESAPKPTIGSYKGQAEFFTTGVAGHVLEPAILHDVFMGYWLSPLEFHVVFKPYKPILDALESKLQALYSDASPTIPEELLVPGTPCCVKSHDNIWQRAVVELGTGERLIRFVDTGENRSSFPRDIKLLDEQFMELPPLAIRCKIIGAHRDTFYQAILDSFRRDCNMGRRRQVKFFAAPEDGVLSVELYNMAGRDLFMKHFGELFRKQEQARRQREEAAKRRYMKVDKATGRIIRLPEPTDDDYYSDDEDMYTGEKLRDVPNGYMVNGEIIRMNDLKLNDEDWPRLPNA